MFSPMTEKEDAILRAAIHWVREMGLLSDAEGLQRLKPALARKLLSQADTEMSLGWDICQDCMSDRETAESRHLFQCAYAKKMGWDTEKPLYIFDRAYILR